MPRPKAAQPTVSQARVHSPRSRKNAKRNQKEKAHYAASEVSKVGGAPKTRQACQLTRADSPENSKVILSNLCGKSHKIAAKVVAAWARWLIGQDLERPVYAPRVRLPLPPIPRQRALVAYPPRLTFLAAP
jgi:hypothetical protein